MAANVNTCEISSSVEAGRGVLTVVGEVDLSVSERFAAAIEALAPDTDLVVDLAEVDFLDSAGLRCLLQGAKSASAAGVRLAVVPSPAVSRVLEMACVVPDVLGVRDAGNGGVTP
jgi:anti-anti-sigma factor